jgi:hypothetical protein
MKNLKQVATDAVRAHLREVAPELELCHEVRVSVELEVDVRCSTCGGTTGAENPDRIAQLRCYWCTKEATKGVMVR